MGTQQRRQREAGQRRQRILDAARALFWMSGYTRTTMPQIAEAAELAPGTLYLYFPSKDALYAELLIEGYDVLIQRLQAVVATTDRPRRQAEALIDAFFVFARQFPEYFQIMFFVLQSEGRDREGSLPAEQVARLEQREEACKAVAARVLSATPAAKPSRRQAISVEAIWSMLAGAIFYFRRDRSFAAVAEESKRLLLAAVFGPQ